MCNLTLQLLAARIMQPTKTHSWKKLEEYAQSMQFAAGKVVGAPIQSQNNTMNVSIGDIFLDYSNQLLDETALELLIELAHECKLKKHIDDLFFGSAVNTTEKKPALHTALRAENPEELFVGDHNIGPAILGAREQMRDISEAIRKGQWLGFSGKAITDVVNIGIGGSQLGPSFCISALKDYTTNALGFYFVSDCDPKAFKRVVAKLNPETTLFIISSKSFSTLETLSNAKKALAWVGQPKFIDRHFIAVTAKKEKAEAFGFNTVLPIWDWVGGRFSLCSAINLITCIAIGYEQFSALLSGASLMDTHFRTADFRYNLPVLLALFGIWNIDFLAIPTLLLLVYAQDLQELVPYIQQLDMESNGKSLDKEGLAVDYATGPIVWGGLGNQAQHSYYQLLCQGTQVVAADFISVDAFEEEPINQMCFAQKTVLTQGVSDSDDAYAYVKGNTPLNHIRITNCTPKVIGSLVALYEHKIFTQAVIWHINPFDQPGVESSKKLLGNNYSPKKSTPMVEIEVPFGGSN